MPVNRYKEVNYSQYCFRCVHAGKKGSEEPCNTCLENFVNEHTNRPTEFEEVTKK